MKSRILEFFKVASVRQIALALFAFNFITKLFYLDARDIAIDEPFSIYHAQMNLSEIIKIFANENNPPLHEFMLHFWTQVFGISAFSVRFPSLIFACTTSVIIFLIGNKIFSKRAGVLAAFVFSLSTFSIYFSHEARVYALFSLLTSLSLFHFLSLLQNKEAKKHFYFLVLYNAIIIYAHYFGFFILIAEGLVSLLFYKRFKILTTIIRLYVFVGICFVPNLFVLYNRLMYSTTKGTWVKPPGIGEVYGNLNRFLNNKYVSLCLIIIVASAIVTLVVNKSLLSSVKKINSNSFIMPLIVWFAFPYFFMFFISFKVPMFIDRYILFNSISFYLIIAVVLAMLINSTRYYSIAAFVLLLSLSCTLKLNPDNNRRVKQVAEVIAKLKNEHNNLIITPAYADLNLLYYYAPSAFINYAGKEQFLRDNKIYGVNSQKDLEEVLLKVKGDVIYLQADYEVLDPGNLFYNTVKNAYANSAQIRVPQIYTITYFRK